MSGQSAFGGFINNDSDLSYTSPDFGITRNRRTHVVFDDPRSVLKEAGYALERSAIDIAQNAFDKRQNSKITIHQAPLGLVIKNFWHDGSLLSERDEASTAMYGAAAGTVAGYMEEVNEWRKPNSSYMLNVLDGASAHLNTSALPMLRKRVEAGEDWVAGLADEAAYIFPSTVASPGATPFQAQFVSDASIAMDRVFVTSANDNERQDLMFIFRVPKASSDTGQLLYEFGFVGPASGRKIEGNGSVGYEGMGQYVIAVYGNGTAILSERLDVGGEDFVWAPRQTFSYAPKSNGNFTVAGDQTYSIQVIKYAYANAPGGFSGKLLFVGGSVTSESTGVEGREFSFNKIIDVRNVENACPSYTAYSYDGKIPTQETAIRVSVRRDLRGSFGVAYAKRPTTATLTDSFLTFPFIPNTVASAGNSYAGAVKLYWNSENPSGCSVTGVLYRADTGAALTEILSMSGPTHRSFILPAGVNCIYAVMTLTCDGYNTPILNSIAYLRDAIYQELTIEETEYDSLRGINILGVERDPKHENATVLLSNLANDATILRSRGSIPFRIEVEWQPDVDRADRCVLFKGYTSRVTARMRSRAGNNRFTPNYWYEYQIQGSGMYQQLRENVNPYNRMLFDPGAGLPFKVTDIIRDLLSTAGFPAGEINIPDLPIRCYASNGPGPAEQLEILGDLGSTIFGLVDKYLGHFLIYDPNAGTRGQWTLVEPELSPYTNRAKFVLGPKDVTPDQGGVVLAHSRRAYASATTPTGFIKKGTLSSWVKPPEANVIIATSFGKTTPNSVPPYLYKVLINFKSYDFGNGLVDTTSPDYLGRMVPMYVMVPEIRSLVEEHPTDSTLLESPALNWVARRIYDVAAHAVKFCTFEAPLLLVDQDDPVTYEKRPLRYYDPVLVNGEQFLIRNVNPTYRKDHMQMAVYECEAPRI